MKIQLLSINKANFTEINFFSKKNEERKSDKSKEILNIKFSQKSLNRRKFIQLIRCSVMEAKRREIENVTYSFAHLKKISKGILKSEELLKIFSENALLANYKFQNFKSKKRDAIKAIALLGKLNSAEKQALNTGEKVAAAMNLVRDLANMPGADMTPDILVKSARDMFKGKPIKLSVVEEAQAKKLKMNLFLAVGRGSQEKSRFIVAEYNGGKKGDRPIVLIGKGVCFDTGGLNIKPGNAMTGMNMDMTGAAIALSTLALAAELKLKKNIVALAPAVENAVGGMSYRPGDIITAMNGKTVEIRNTDAEGRLILADALTYAKRYNARLVVDIATLTGSALVVLGQKASVIMTKDEKLEELMRDLGEQTGDYVWPLPLWEEYEKDIESDFADIANLGKTKYGGTITAAIFLAEFTKDYNKDTSWVHIDIAPRMEAAQEDCLERGSTGEPVRMLLELIKKY
ncbi:MAG: leucyl aminopeptidase family protein [bacterium]|nr:leucyl aminopeptidase family protein [bacterium]